MTWIVAVPPVPVAASVTCTVTIELPDENEWAGVASVELLPSPKLQFQVSAEGATGAPPDCVTVALSCTCSAAVALEMTFSAGVTVRGAPFS